MTFTVLGLIAGTITSVAGIPQLIRVYRTKQVRDLSVWQPILLTIGITLWLIYGIAISDIPLIVADIVSLICCLLLLMLIFRYRDDNAEIRDYISYESFKGGNHETGISTDDDHCCGRRAVRVRIQHDAGKGRAGICSVG